MLPLAPLSRRRALEIGGISLLGLTCGELNRARADVSRPVPSRSCIFVFLFGGPSQIDLWDMKPRAPLEIRGEFQPVATNVAGLELCEHLPRLARQADKLCLLRSMTHQMNVHGPACSELYSGREYFGPPVTDQALPQDWPSIASLVARSARASAGLPASVVLPWYSQFVGQDRRIAGQTGGRMGAEFDPFLVTGDLTADAFDVAGLASLPELDGRRLAARRVLRRELQSGGGHRERGGTARRSALRAGI